MNNIVTKLVTNEQKEKTQVNQFNYELMYSSGLCIWIKIIAFNCPAVFLFSFSCSTVKNHTQLFLSTPGWARPTCPRSFYLLVCPFRHKWGGKTPRYKVFFRFYKSAPFVLLSSRGTLPYFFWHAENCVQTC